MLLLFIMLQLLDACTTLFFLHHGIREGSRVRAPFAAFSIPAVGLAMASWPGVALGVFAWRTGRQRLLSRVNLVFACMMWNLAATVLARA